MNPAEPRKRESSGDVSVNLKKPKMDAGGSGAGSAWAADLFGEASVKDLRERFHNAEPYKHVAIDGVCDDAKMKVVREQLISGLKADFKETDIFKVFQTGDLANLTHEGGKDSANVSDLIAFRDAIYGPQFRNFVKEVVGCDELSSQVDCSCNVYPQGGHLLCHDDVIGTRCVSYIIYFTDPDLEWTEAAGGALELYPVQTGSDGTSEPTVLPSKSLLPAWNRMVLFKVTPGASFHSVQEVFGSEDHRLSISGWFHAADQPADAHKASLKQLKAMEGKDTCRSFSQLSCDSSGDALPNECRTLLSNWVNPSYLKDDSIESIYQKFLSEGSIQLQDFILPSVLNGILEEAKAIDARQLGRKPPTRYDLGTDGGWEAVGPPHKQRYMRFNGGDEKCGALMKTLTETLFQSPEFACLLHHMTGAIPDGFYSEVRRFRPGLDYTVAHYGVLSQDTRLDAVLCIVDDQDENDDEAWAGGEVGGYEAYLLADEDDDGNEGKEAADVYRLEEDEGGVLSVSPACNTLNLVLRDRGLMRFVKYVGASAPGSRWDIAVEYHLGDESYESEEGEVMEEG
ncbi:hypothetical protein BSKO_03792 [Bryopsis sp. KO-2023]|nr:hypothetical protein BSKO_03792 [Bryopsis sp. KO-2023]